MATACSVTNRIIMTLLQDQAKEAGPVWNKILSKHWKTEIIGKLLQKS